MYPTVGAELERSKRLHALISLFLGEQNGTWTSLSQVTSFLKLTETGLSLGAKKKKKLWSCSLRYHNQLSALFHRDTTFGPTDAKFHVTSNWREIPAPQMKNRSTKHQPVSASCQKIQVSKTQGSTGIRYHWNGPRRRAVFSELSEAEFFSPAERQNMSPPAWGYHRVAMPPLRSKLVFWMIITAQCGSLAPAQGDSRLHGMVQTHN